jgi:hypothetical protein
MWAHVRPESMVFSREMSIRERQGPKESMQIVRVRKLERYTQTTPKLVTAAALCSRSNARARASPYPMSPASPRC